MKFKILLVSVIVLTLFPYIPWLVSFMYPYFVLGYLTHKIESKYHFLKKYVWISIPFFAFCLYFWDSEYTIYNTPIKIIDYRTGTFDINNLYVTLTSAFISGIGTTICSIISGSDVKEALWKGGMTALCTAVSINAIIELKTPILDVVKNVSGTIFGIGNGLVTAGVVASLPYRKSSSKKNPIQNKSKSNPVVKKSSKTKKQQERARKYFMFKMNQLRE